MDRTNQRADDHGTASRIDLELGLAHGAIELVRGGRSTHVVVGGLRFCDAVLPEAQRLALGTGVSVVALPGIDEAAQALVFQREAE